MLTIASLLLEHCQEDVGKRHIMLLGKFSALSPATLLRGTQSHKPSGSFTLILISMLEAYGHSLNHANSDHGTGTCFRTIGSNPAQRQRSQRPQKTFQLRLQAAPRPLPRQSTVQRRHKPAQGQDQPLPRATTPMWEQVLAGL